MRGPYSVCFIIVFVFAMLTGSVTAFSADAKGLPRPPIRAGAAPASSRIETDPKTGVIRFIVKGREEARIDATGLHVRQHVSYGGVITDVGEAGYDSSERPAGNGKP